MLSEQALADSGALQVETARAMWSGFLLGDGRLGGMGIRALVNFKAWWRRWGR